jgi:Ran GTPase-activating protein (RanGAP) involved in mRNA processing and transport
MIEADYQNRIQDEDDLEKGFLEILEESKKDKELERINLPGNRLSAKQIQQLATALLGHTKLQYLNLNANDGIHEAAFQALKKIIETHPTLEILMLQYNKIADKEIKVLVVG